MPKVAVRFAESALTDLEALKRWYAEQAVPEVGDRLLREIIESIEALAEHPEMGRIVPEIEQPFLRELIRPPLRIVYRRDPKHVRVALPATAKRAPQFASPRAGPRLAWCLWASVGT